MEGEEGGGLRLSKRFSDKGDSGEVDYKTKAGTAWSHSYLNQKPWHPLSYPNQRRKWIAEQTHSQRERRAEEVSREYAQEQEFFRQTALVSKKEKEKLEIMKAVSFMYVRPPGYNAESAKAAEIADEMKREEGANPSQDLPKDGPSIERPPESLVSGDHSEKKKSRPKDVFGRALPTEEEFEVLKNAPRMDTGVYARVKPFGVEVRNVKCVRCGIFGHQSGDRECPLKDAIMPNEENRLKRDDPLTTIIAHADPSEPLKWELKQKPGISPPRGGFKPDDPNQQIVAEDIFDEYGGFLSGGIVPELLSNFSTKPKKKKSLKQSSQKKNQSSPNRKDKDIKDEEKASKKKKISKRKKQICTESSSGTSEVDRHEKRSRHKVSHTSDDSDSEMHDRTGKSRRKHSFSSVVSGRKQHRKKRNCYESSSLDFSKHSGHYKGAGLEEEERVSKQKKKSKRKEHIRAESSSDDSRSDRREERKNKDFHSSDDSDSEMHNRTKKSRRKQPYSYGVSDREQHREERENKDFHSSDDSDSETHNRTRKSRRKQSYSYGVSDREQRHEERKNKDFHSSDHSDSEMHNRTRKSRRKQSYSYDVSDREQHYRKQNCSTSSSSNTSESDTPDKGKRHKYSYLYKRPESELRHKPNIRENQSYSSKKYDVERHQKSEKSILTRCYSSKSQHCDHDHHHHHR